MVLQQLLTVLYCCYMIFGQSVTDNPEIIKRIEYKYSFKPPEVAANDGTIPLWSLSGHAIPSSDEIRLVSSLPNQKGSMWASRPYMAQDWEFEASIRIGGKGNTGSNGMAFWFVSEKSTIDTNFGGPDKWNGLSVILDSVDNDKKANNPIVAAFVNNGSYAYDEGRDGEHQLSVGCITNYRNKPFPVYLKVNYFKQTLTLQISDGLSAKPNYHPCGVKKNINLPKAGYFGISASTGNNNADDHDCFSFIVHSIVPREHAVTQDAIQRKQLEKYLQKAKEIHTAQNEYARLHPDKVKHRESTGEAISLGNEHDMKLVYEMHSEIRESINFISSKLNEIIGRLESSSLMMTKLSSTDGSPISGADGSQNKNEFQRILQSQIEVVNSNRRLLQDVSAAMMQMQQISQNHGDDSLKQILLEKISILVNRKQIPRSNQHSTKLLWIVIILQSLTLIGAIILLGRAEQNVKKFY